LSLDKSSFAQSLVKCSDHASGLASRAAVEKSDYRHCGLLRPRSKRPSHCRTAEKRYETAAEHLGPQAQETAF
jgi:hypothetical protein